MDTKEALFDQLTQQVCALGARNAAVIRTTAIEKDAAFRDMCAANSCGLYGKCWTCPPDIGEIHELMARIDRYAYALVYQSIGALDDSFDFEGMIQAKRNHFRLTIKVKKALLDFHAFSKVLHLGAGGCGICEVCAKRTNEPCRYPELAVPSLEAFGVNVSRMAAAAGMKYINGVNTVTYFSAILFSLREHEERYDG